MAKPAVEPSVDFASIKNLTVLRRNDDINHALKSRDSVPLKGDIPESGRPFNTGSLLSINGEAHLARRRMYSSPLSNESLAAHTKPRRDW